MKAKSLVLVCVLFYASIQSFEIVEAGDYFHYDGSTYSFHRYDVPDLDQIRSSFDNSVPGLPNDGLMYCAPTSAVNWMAYIANHGYPNVSPGPGNWEVSPPQFIDEYNHITSVIQQMGDVMGTDPYDGTTGDSVQVLENWLSTGPFQYFSVNDIWADGDWSPRVEDAALASINGGFVNLSIGWYSEPDPDGPAFRFRNGGHVVSLVAGHSLLHSLSVNDPMTHPGEDWLTGGTKQSAFAEDSSGFESATACFGYIDDIGGLHCFYRTQDQLDYVTNGFVDGYLAMFPDFEFSFADDELLFLYPIELPGPRPERVQQIRPFPGKNILDVAIHPFHLQRPFLVEGSNSVWMADPITGAISTFAELQNPQRLAFGGKKGNLYVLSGSEITSLDRSGRVNGSARLRNPEDAIAFDEENQRLIGVSRSAKTIEVFDEALKSIGEYAIEADVTGDGSRISISINPVTGQIGVFFAGASYYSLIEIDRSGIRSKVRVALPSAVRNAEAFYMDARGIAYVSDQGAIVAFDPFGRQVDSPFSGLNAGQGLLISRSYTNFDPQTMRGRAFRNVPPTYTPSSRD